MSKSLSLVLAALVAGCSVVPVYEKPAAPAAAAFKETIPPEEAGRWKIAEPSDALARGAWWTVFDDPRLAELEAEAGRSNLELQAAYARLQRSRALARASAADRLPSVDVGAGVTRARPSPASQGLPADADTRAATLWRAEARASYEVDLFGRVAGAVEASRADAAQSQALLASLLLAIQADVAQHWLAIRGLDAEIALLDETVRLRDEALRLVERRQRSGEVGEIDTALARVELGVARSERVALAQQRAAFEHALAVLVGKAPAELAVGPVPLAFRPVAIPPGLPSALLERRPDIAAAERAMAAANARVGVARAAKFPTLGLTGALGFESAELGDLARWSSRTWLLGPLVGTLLSAPLLDGGRRDALADAARAGYDEAVAGYRQQVLLAFREVEDGLAALRLLAERAREQAAAVAAAERAAQLSGTRWRAGYVNYLEVIDAERSLLGTRRAATQIERERALATVALIRALGGGWDAAPALSQGPR